jgi:hypothetical protein
MSAGARLTADLLHRKGEAKPRPEPEVRPRAGGARRVGARLPTDLYVLFKAYVAREGLTGEQAIAAAIEQLVRDI